MSYGHDWGRPRTIDAEHICFDWDFAMTGELLFNEATRRDMTVASLTR